MRQVPLPALLSAPLRLATAAVVVVIVASLAFVLRPQNDVVHVSAQFSRTVSLYEGSEVRILGVPVGQVTSITPAGTSVRVEMVYDAQYKVPADAKAVIVSPSLVGDRFIQLTPGYQGGPVMADGTEIPRKRTQTPVELDRAFSNLNDIVTALGPKGANAEGSLSQLLEVGAKNLKGQGENINQSIEDLSQAANTLSKGRKDLFATVRQLQSFVTELAQNDKQMRRFTRNLSSVSEQLAGERKELEQALGNLAVALGEVEAFVRANKNSLTKNVEALTSVTSVLARQRRALEKVLQLAPLGLSNLALAYNPATGTVNARFLNGQLEGTLSDLDGVLCQYAKQYGLPNSEQTCQNLESLLEWLPAPGRTSSPVDDLVRGLLGRPGGSRGSGRQGQSSQPALPALPGQQDAGPADSSGASKTPRPLSSLLGGGS